MRYPPVRWNLPAGKLAHPYASDVPVDLTDRD